MTVLLSVFQLLGTLCYILELFVVHQFESNWCTTNNCTIAHDLQVKSCVNTESESVLESYGISCQFDECWLLVKSMDRLQLEWFWAAHTFFGVSTVKDAGGIYFSKLDCSIISYVNSLKYNLLLNYYWHFGSHCCLLRNDYLPGVVAANSK